MTADDRTKEMAPHYEAKGGETHWDMMWRRYREAWFVGNVTKYVLRYRSKNGIEDLKKARHYLDKLIELETAEKDKWLDYVHRRTVGGETICGAIKVVTTSRLQDVTCPTCREKAPSVPSPASEEVKLTTLAESGPLVPLVLKKAPKRRKR